MANKKYIERLQMVISQLHNCASTWIESAPVHEVFNGKTIWQGTVEIFVLSHHPEAKRCYAWSHCDGPDDKDERFVTVLGLPPVVSPETAVKAAAAKEIEEARKKHS